jgi:hypothetical protein
MRKTVPIITASFKKHLPDGDLSGTRALQSPKSRARFPSKLKNSLVSKQVKDHAGVLQLVGIGKKTTRGKKPARHVRFDHGDKGRKGVGRKHVLWGRFNEKRTQPPLYRRQVYDVRELVRLEVRDRCVQIVTDAVRKAIKKQMRES